MKSEKDRLSYGIPHMWNLKKMVQMNLLTKQKESETQKTNLQLLGGKERRDKLGDWNGHVYTTKYKMDN